MGIKAQMAVSCGLLPVLLALGVYAAVAATIMQTSEIEEDNTDLLAKLNADLDALIETGETMDTAPAAAAPPAPPPSPEAVETKAKYGHVHHNEKPMASLTAIPGYKPSDKEKAEAKDPDPFKQGKTYTPELRHHEERVKAKDPAVFDLNHFKTPAAKIKRAQKIAQDIHKLVHGEPETPGKRTLRLIKQKGEKDAAFLHRIVQAKERRDNEDRRKSRKRQKKLKKQKKKPKLAVKDRIEATLDKEDENYVKSIGKKGLEPWAVAEVEKEGRDPQTGKMGAPPLVKYKDAKGHDQYHHP